MKAWTSILVPAVLATLAHPALGQTTGSLSGTIVKPDGTLVDDAPIRVRSAATGVDVRTRSGEAGTFEFRDLPPGDYVVSVNMPCCQYFPFVDDTIVVTAGDVTEADIALVAFNINVEGDNPATVNAELLAGADIPDRPAPRMPDGRPDLTGFWLFNDDPYPEDPQLLDWAGPIVQQRVERLFIDTPEAHCLPTDPPVSGGASFTVKFVQRPELLVALLEDVAGFRQIYLDGREHPENLSPTWMGHSTGHWEGDTLVIETVGFNDRGWTDIYPRTEQLRLEERYTRTDYGHLEVAVTYDDPGVFAQPWSRRMTWNLAPPHVDLMEYVCENNQWQGAGQ